ncbi:MAG TPA: OB-fold domain-containing protein [Acidimicrobiales bacterium]|nr:OB-fold domain-containing protein [Acidimicrobiales bacterium]
MPAVIPPVPDSDDEFFWDGVNQGQLLLRCCAGCGRLQHPPSPMCPVCHSLKWTTREASGRGTVYSWIVSHHPTEADALPRIVVLVDLEEGVRLVSNLQGVAPSEVRNGMAIELCFDDFDGVALPQFRPAHSVEA